MDFHNAALALSWLAILVLAMGMSGLLRQIEMIKARGVTPGSGVGLRPGNRAPSVPETNGKPSLLVFAEGQCDSCSSLLPELQTLAVALEGDIDIVLLMRGPAAEIDLPPNVQVSFNPQAFRDFRVSLVPAAVGVSRDGIVISAEPVGNPARFRSFVSSFQTVALGGV